MKTILEIKVITEDELWAGVTNSQACQRNWNLDREIPQEHLDLMIHAATQAPTKQNYSYFDLYVVTDRNRIQKLYEMTEGATIRNTTTREPKIVLNTQTNANALFVFDLKMFNQMSQDYIDDQDIQEHDIKEQFEMHNGKVLRIFNDDRQRAFGICSGQLALVANLLGYRTGYCQCFYQDNVEEDLGMRGDISIMLGVGFPDESKPRLEHPDLPGWNFMKKQREETRVIKL